jgi:glutamate--cysteine ligase
VLALPAFWTGLLYDGTALDAAWDLVKDLDAPTREELRVVASERALQGEAGGMRLLDLARAALGVAEEGLRARSQRGIPDERPFLQPLWDSVGSGRVQADELLARFEGTWKGDLRLVYEACRL